MFAAHILEISYFVTKHCDKRVCLSVCMSVRLHISKTTQPNFIEFPVHVECSLGSAVRWQRCDASCTSGFVNIVTFSRNGPYSASCLFISGDSVTAENTASIPTKFCSTIKISKYTGRLRTGGASLLSTIALFAVYLSFLVHSRIIFYLFCDVQ